MRHFFFSENAFHNVESRNSVKLLRIVVVLLGGHNKIPISTFLQLFLLCFLLFSHIGLSSPCCFWGAIYMTSHSFTLFHWSTVGHINASTNSKPPAERREEDCNLNIQRGLQNIFFMPPSMLLTLHNILNIYPGCFKLVLFVCFCSLKT